MRFSQPRRLLVVADDFGIGPNTTAGILQLASQGIITGAVVLVNAPAVVEAIQQWRRLGSPLELGWHPNLTLDAPLAQASQVPTLVRPDGSFWPLPSFLKRWLFGLLNPVEIRLELTLQLQRFTDLVGHPPLFLNFHQHISLFAPVGKILLQVLSTLRTRPYVRRVQEPCSVLCRLPGARLKRAFLGSLGRRLSRIQQTRGFPGNDWLAGLTNPPCTADRQFFTRWLAMMPGQVVELMCHPGHLDATLLGRDCTETDGLMQQRVNEMTWLQAPSFMQAVHSAGFQLTTPAELLDIFCEKQSNRQVMKAA